MPIYWKDDEEGQEKAEVELYETPKITRRQIWERIFLMWLAALLAMLITRC